MDESSRLISELQCKLQELDCKVTTYRQDMTLEYTKYVEGLLRDVSKNVSEQVKNAIAVKMTEYTSLAPPSSSTMPSSNEAVLPDNSIPTPSLSNLSGELSKDANLSLSATGPLSPSGSSEAPRSPHAREAEFTGLFTPTYLPLLDSNDRNERRSSQTDDSTISTSEIPSIPISFEKPKETLPAPITMSSSYDNSYEQGFAQPKPPTPRRRNTDEVSMFSDSSDGPKRRSALRRTSSASKAQSPRRVRFEFEGEEFTTTSSPKPPTPIVEFIEEEEKAQAEPSLLDSDDECGAEMVEDVNEAPPKRISSSQALRNLSKGPIENDGTKWTEVLAPPDGSPSVEGTAPDSEDSDEDDGFLSMGKAKRTATRTEEEVSKAAAPNTGEQSTSQSQPPTDTAGEEQDTVTDLVPTQMPFHSARQPASSMSSATPAVNQTSSTKAARSEANTLQTRSPRSASFDFHDESEDDDDELFGFEEAPGKSQQKYLDHDSSDDDEPATTKLNDLSASSRPPPRDIIAHNPSPQQPMGSVPRNIGPQPSNIAKAVAPHDAESFSSSPSEEPATVKPGSLYSTSHNVLLPSMNPSLATSPALNMKFSAGYHPFSSPIIDPALHNKISRMNTGSSFVGSMGGKSGLDETDPTAVKDDTRVREMARERIGSFADVGMATSFVGSVGMSAGPRSLSERMRLEELMEEEKP